jgi:hypothetical protein
MVKLLKLLIEIAVEVECNNMYDCIDFNVNKIIN